MTKKEYSRKFLKAKKLWQERQYSRAIPVILGLEKSKLSKKHFEFYLFFSDCFNSVGQYPTAVKYLRRAVKLKPDHELASNYLYVNLINNKKYQLGINELSRFLKKYPARKNYRVTLRELLDEFNKGKSLKYGITILDFAVRNNIKVAPKKLRGIILCVMGYNKLLPDLDKVKNINQKYKLADSVFKSKFFKKYFTAMSRLMS